MKKTSLVQDRIVNNFVEVKFSLRQTCMGDVSHPLFMLMLGFQKFEKVERIRKEGVIFRLWCKDKSCALQSN
jgi:hypothetical protein